MELIIMLAGSAALDLIFGEPPLPIHPVAWMGKFTEWWAKPEFFGKPVFQFICGALLTLITISLFTLPVYFGLKYLQELSLIAFTAAGLLILKTTFSFKELIKAAALIKTLLKRGEIEEARFNLRALVKRDNSNLNESLIISAASESAAENASDSFTAPLFYFLLLGVPGAVGYRAVNTMDAMIGRHGEYEYLGKFAARLDDILNFIPARITAILITITSLLIRQNPLSSLKTMLGDHGKTESPNAGWPMAAAAGALKVQFIKIGHYEIGQPENEITLSTISNTLKLVSGAAFLWFIIMLILIVIFSQNYVILPLL
jgi:adenosylcobinamide-phosphate synthase